MGAQWLSGRVLDSRPRGRGFEPHLHHCIVSLSKNINPSLVLVQPRKTCPFITERLLMGRKESNQTNNQTNTVDILLNSFLAGKVFFHLPLTFANSLDPVWTQIRPDIMSALICIQTVWHWWYFWKNFSKKNQMIKKHEKLTSRRKS